MTDPIKAQWYPSDELSGLDYDYYKTRDPIVTPIDTSTAGEKTFIVENIDKAGNKTVKTVKYYVR
ncbi:MAG: hypothetical protein ACOY46_14245 [Bacillota bacterium]